MAKRKVEESDEESAAYSDESSAAEAPVAKSKKAAKPRTIKKPVIQQSEESDSDDDEKPVSKKAKREPKEKASSSSAGPSSSSKAKTNKDGEKYIDLGKKKLATVRVFKGMPLLDIREFYGDESDLKPGKKGISLTLEQWAVLRDSVNELDDLLSKVKK